MAMAGSDMVQVCLDARLEGWRSAQLAHVVATSPSRSVERTAGCGRLQVHTFCDLIPLLNSPEFLMDTSKKPVAEKT